MYPNIRPLNNELKKIASEVLNENDACIPEEIASFRAWLLQQPHLKARTDDQYLLTFLRGSKHSLERAKLKIDYFYTIKTMLPEIFANKVMNAKFCEFARAGIYVWPPAPKDTAWPSLTITRFNNFNEKNFTFIDLMRFRNMVMERSLSHSDNCVVAGLIEIYDLARISYSLYAQADLLMIKKLRVFVEKGLPLRFQGIHILNCPTEYTSLLRLVIKKHKQRFHVHKNLEDLYKFVSKDYLPTEYGGTNGSILEIALNNEQEIQEINHLLIADDKYGVDENFRLDKTVCKTSSFGLEGSFKKLEID